MDDWRKPCIAMDHRFNNFVFVFYCQIAASLLMVPTTVLLER
jgi:hypothetical protein